MLIYLYGPDTYRRGEKVRAVLTQYQKSHPDAPIRHFDFREEADRETFVNFLRTPSLFGGYACAVVHEFSGVQDVADCLRTASTSTTATVLLVGDEKASGVPSLCAFQEFPAFSGARLLSFIRQEAARRGVHVTEEITSALCTLGDSWSVVTELDKLALGARHETPPADTAFFPLVQRLARGSFPARIASLAYVLAEEDAARVFNVLAALVGEEKKTRMANYDIAVKSGKLEYEEALLDYVLTDSQ